MNKKIIQLTLASLFVVGGSYAQKANESILKKFNEQLNAKAPEDSLENTAYRYARSLKSQAALDSLSKIIVTVYPKGNTAATQELISLFAKQKAGNLTLSDLNNLKLSYPNVSFNSQKNTPGMYYSVLVSSAFPQLLEKDSANAVALIKDMPSSSLNQIAWNFAEKNIHTTIAEKMSKLSLEKEKTKFADSTKIPANERSEYMQNLRESYSSFEDTYAYVLSKLGKYKEAIPYQEDAIKVRKDDPDMNTRYILLLNKNKQTRKALALGSELYMNNHGSKEMLEQILIAYKKENKGKSSEAFVKGLEEKREVAAKADLQKSVINKPSPNFTLKNLQGNDVSLSDYKGKIVVLDFWATWCGPCKMSFPGMQLAVNKYKNNPNIVFLFIDTWENTDPNETKSAVDKFIKEKGYSFHVLLDKKSNNKDFDVAKAYTPFGITGIPVKFFIGKDGQVKFMETGYPGSDDKVLRSVDERVEYLLKENS